ncbi:MAG: hypothetical protein J7M11_05600, partial [Elusimicrobia bacterium]|nr:hypothetical protein [Elusimicrobiota bacterium]
MAIAKVGEVINIQVLRIVLWLVAGFLFTRFMLNGQGQRKSSGWNFIATFKKNIILSIFFAGNIYFALMSHHKIVSHLGMWETMLRYPPIGKIIYLAGFMFFGIQEFVPRVIQFAFIIAAAVFLVKTLR